MRDATYFPKAKCSEGSSLNIQFKKNYVSKNKFILYRRFDVDN